MIQERSTRKLSNFVKWITPGSEFFTKHKNAFRKIPPRDEEPATAVLSKISRRLEDLQFLRRADPPACIVGVISPSSWVNGRGRR
jgi:hypothetical protein